MITVLLEKIIAILEGWIQSFTSHSQHVEDKLDSLDQTASDIETNTAPISDIRDNTGAVITPIQNIKSNTDSIATSSQTSANNTTAILNNISTLSTNTGRAAAYAQDCANNTLDIKDKVTTIASDTTQIRAISSNIAADVSSINQAIGYYIANTPVTEDLEAEICNFDTDLEDYLQKLKVNIPADINGFSSITLNKIGKNIFPINISINDNTYTHVYIPTTSLLEFFNRIVGKNISYSANVSGTPSGVIVGQLRFLVGGSSLFTLNPNSTQIVPNEDFTTVTQIIVYGSTNGAVINNVQMEIGDSISEYEPYKVMTYPVSFGSTITDGAEADLLSGLVKVNTTPATFIQISPIAVRTYKGVNNIFSDIGTSALTYRETLKHYLDKNNQ